MVEMSDKEKYKFKRELEEIKERSGRGTELISLYIPPDKRISDVVAYLRNEYSQSSNIKSKGTKKNVTAAIESILSKLKYFKTPPANGLAIFVGHIITSANQTTMVSFILEPPDPIVTFLYRCDSQFYTLPLEEMLTEKENYGLLVIDRSEATIGILKGKRVKPIKNVQSLVPSKHSKGGQSARRFERLIEIAAHDYFKKIGGLVNEAFLNENDMIGIIIGGPGATKEYFVKGEYIHHELKKKIIDTFDTGYTNEYGLRELVENATSALANLDLIREKNLIQRFLNEIRKEDGGLAAYGEDNVRHALKIGAVDVLLLSEELRKLRIKRKCENCDYSTIESCEGYVDESPIKCPKCQSSFVIIEKTDIIDEFYKMADEVGTSVELISTESEEGDLFLRAFDGFAGILRFKVDARR
jgi:peptide chain release factor subunit 1